MTNVQTTRRSSCGKSALFLIVATTLSLSEGSSILAQEGAQLFSRQQVSGGASSIIDQNRRAFGTLFRAGHTAGDTVGRTDSLSHISLAPYFNHEDTMLFGDMRLARANEGPLAWSFGSGLRHYIPDWDVVIGGNGYLDRDELTGALLRSWGIGGEVLAHGWEGRFNYYRPHGTTSTLVSQTIDQTSAAFVGNNITFNRIDTVAEALHGFDLEGGFLLPCGPLEDHLEMRAFAGAYQYKGDTIPQFTGWQTRLQADIADWLELGLKLTEDSQFKTGISFSAVVYFGEFKSQDHTRHSAIHRMAEPVRRNLNIAATRTPVVVGGLVAIDPNDGLALEVVHVNSNDAVGPFVGTVEDPFNSLTAGLGVPGADVVFTHAGSNFAAAPDNMITIGANQSVFGEGLITLPSGDRFAVNTVPILGLGELQLPNSPTFVASGLTLGRPVMDGAVGDAVTLNNGSRFGGFIVQNVTGNGIISNGAADTQIRDVLVQNTTLDGIVLNATTGTTTVIDTVIQDTTGAAFHVNGGTGSIGYQSTSTGIDPAFGHIANSSQQAVLIENMGAGGIVNMFGSTINDTGGTGILIQNNLGNATIDNARIVDSTSTGIQVLNSSGTYNFRNSFRGNTFISNAALQSVLIDGLGATGSVLFDSLQVNNRQGAGIDINNNSGQINFLNSLILGAPAVGGTGAAVSVDGSQAGSSVTFNDSLTITGSNGRGIELTNNLAGSSFSAMGQTTISGAVDESIAIVNDGGTTLFGDGTGISIRGERGISIQNSTGDISFLGITNISNELADLNPTPAVDIQNSEADVTFEALAISGATTGGAPGGAGINLLNNMAGATNGALLTFGNIAVTTVDGAGLFGINNTSIQILGGSINSTGAAAVDLEESGWNIELDNLTSIGSPDFGVRLVNAAPTTNIFTVGADTAVPAIGTSGSIQAAGLSGALLANAGRVGFAGMLFDSNTIGIAVLNSGLADNDSQRLELAFTAINGSAIRGIDATNLTTLDISDSLFDDNGNDAALGRETILLSYNETPNDPVTTLFSQFTNRFEVFIRRTQITDNTDDAISIIGLAGATGAHIDVALEDNNFTLDGGTDPDATDLDETAFEFDWNGVARVFINNNNVTMAGLEELQSQTAFDIRNRSTTDELLFSLLNNDLLSSHDNALGLNLRTLGPSDSLIQNNQFAFSGLDAEGMRFNLAGDALMNLDSNELRFDNDGGAGMIFSLVSQPSIFTINNNLIGLLDNGGLIEEGIRFSAAIGAPILQGNQSNEVFLLNPGAPGAFIEVPFSFGGSAIGGIIVNGVTVP